MNIVVLDGAVVNPGDLSWDVIAKYGDLTIHDRTSAEELVGRAKKADIILSNKCRITKENIDELPNLKCICLLATGYDNIDIKAAKEKGILVSNAAGYGSTSVSQHVFALILAITNKVSIHSKMVHEGAWSNSKDWSFCVEPIVELAGKTLGIYGLGKIGNKVADIAAAMDMKVLATHKHPERDKRDDVQFVDRDILFATSDFITLHTPLTEDNREFVNYNLLQTMKDTAILINTGRGGLINESDLKRALLEKTIAGAALDVLLSEPPPEDHVLFGVLNCIITPHNAWATVSSRRRLLNIVGKNIEAFIAGEPINVIV